jgi:hypothetical protein
VPIRGLVVSGCQLEEQTARPGEGRYTSRIIKAGALLPDTKTLLSHWDAAATVDDNLGRIRHENVFGKASRSRVWDILAIFRQQYLANQEVVQAVVILVEKRLPAASLDRIIFFHAAQSDGLLHDVVTEWLAPAQGRGIADIDVDEVQRLLWKCVAEGRTSGEWSGETTRKVAHGLLSTLRDFGVYQGAARSGDWGRPARRPLPSAPGRTSPSGQSPRPGPADIGDA